MNLFALGDPHLSFDENGKEYKPMGIFGDSWLNHGEKIRRHWLEAVTAEDVVLLPGDISWSMTLETFQSDLAFLAALPGKKIISKGNHDLWWDSLSKIKKYCRPTFRFYKTTVMYSVMWQSVVPAAGLVPKASSAMSTTPKFFSES